MQCFHDYRMFCPKMSEEWAIDLYLSAPNRNLAPPPMISNKINGSFWLIFYFKC